MDVAVAIAIMAAITRMAERARGRGDDRPRRATDDRPDRSAYCSASNDASRRPDRLHWRGAGAERQAPQRYKSDLVHDVILPPTIGEG